jgi:hypothetical protein
LSQLHVPSHLEPYNVIFPRLIHVRLTIRHPVPPLSTQMIKANPLLSTSSSDNLLSTFEYLLNIKEKHGRIINPCQYLRLSMRSSKVLKGSLASSLHTSIHRNHRTDRLLVLTITNPETGGAGTNTVPDYRFGIGDPTTWLAMN